MLHRIFDLLRKAPLTHGLPRTVHSPDAPVVCPRPRRVIIEIRELGRIRIDAMDGGREAVEVFRILRRDFDLIARSIRISCVGIDRIEKDAAISLAIGIVRDGRIALRLEKCALHICRLRIGTDRMPIQIVRPYTIKKRLLCLQLSHVQHEAIRVYVGIPVNRGGCRSIRSQVFGELFENLHLASDGIQILRPGKAAVWPFLLFFHLRGADFTAVKIQGSRSHGKRQHRKHKSCSKPPFPLDCHSSCASLRFFCH